MGRAIALQLAKNGASIVCCDLQETPNPSGFEKDINVSTVELITRDSGSSIFCAVDISVGAEIEKAIEKTRSVRAIPIASNCED